MSLPVAQTMPKVIATGSGVLTRVSRATWEPVLMPGQKVRVQLGSQFAVYEVPRSQVPYPLFETYINFATFQNPLAAMLRDGSQTGIPLELDTLDVIPPGVGQYKFVVLTEGVEVELNQPAGVGRFRNKGGSVRFSYESTYSDYEQKNYAALPEVWAYGDQTSLKATVYNLDINRTKPVVTLMVFGMYYPLSLIKNIQEAADGTLFWIETLPNGQEQVHVIQAAMTIDVGQPV